MQCSLLLLSGVQIYILEKQIILHLKLGQGLKLSQRTQDHTPELPLPVPQQQLYIQTLIFRFDTIIQMLISNFSQNQDIRAGGIVFQ